MLVNQTEHLIKNDQWMMEILEAVDEVDLPDSLICAGFIRSKIWDILHGYQERTPITDIDVIYYDSHDISEKSEKLAEAELWALNPGIPWSVKNQARMHIRNGDAPYHSSSNALSHFPETATAIGVTLRGRYPVIVAPLGLDDLFKLKVKPTPHYIKNWHRKKEIFKTRALMKNWQKRWPNLVYEFPYIPETDMRST